MTRIIEISILIIVSISLVFILGEIHLVPLYAVIPNSTCFVWHSGNTIYDVNKLGFNCIVDYFGNDITQNTVIHFINSHSIDHTNSCTFWNSTFYAYAPVSDLNTYASSVASGAVDNVNKYCDPTYLKNEEISNKLHSYNMEDLGNGTIKYLVNGTWLTQQEIMKTK